jgi:hypothetical protein
MKLVREGDWGHGDPDVTGDELQRESERLSPAQYPPGNEPRTLIARPADAPEREA